MEVAPQPTNGDNSSSRSRADSNASSDWDDWADAMVAQGEPPGESAAAGGAPGGGVGGGGGGGMAVDEQDEEWVRSLMEQGTVGSVIEGMESPAWDYVLQMVVEERERGGAATVESPVQEITGVAATEFVSRWLRSNLPITLPALNALKLIEGGCAQQHQRIGSRSGDGQEQRRVRGGRALADSVAEPSSVAVVSCSPEQGMHRVNLFSLSANSGAALAAAVVQPGAVGLLVPPVGAAALGEETVARGYNSNDTRGSSGEVSGRRSTGPGCSDRGVVFESLDSRILEDALVSTMRRLGLGLKKRSRSGMWKLRPGAVLPAGDTSITSAEVRPVTLEDVGLIARCCSSGLGEVGRSEALVRGLIGRNPSAGIRRGSQLVAWCLSFDNGLAGALYIAPQTTESGLPLPILPPLASGGQEEGQFSPRNMVLALLGSLLARPPGTDRAANNTPTARTDDEATRSVSDAASSTEEKQVGLSGSSLAHGRGAGGGVSVGLEAVVVDDDSPFVGLFGELELLERVCDADWVRFEPLTSCSSGASGAPAVVAPVPLSALVLNP
ncbi:expressed unknown protein [Ectocarpus siliculosus]|uniref:Uncharacterized protein n=1 Tax=Ectocarpus siliculosus TaxID=2880 RepID=D8LBB1_ECTSI|nr:expressed unknown protein [Ectocarpus siliculosus]|eukprot:CBN76620.1 expressed unknown protein [Ectocarpus siliculosus]